MQWIDCTTLTDWFHDPVWYLRVPQTVLGSCIDVIFLCSDENDENQDTVEQILKCIIENEGKQTVFIK